MLIGISKSGYSGDVDILIYHVLKTTRQRYTGRKLSVKVRQGFQ